ncbi:peptidoglycan-binding domain-containing protein, partial [Streptomyces sp. ME109]|uniref:peptidoglycan-binding domain-containing protein n=1 Tax=Streptomyces sp. me109 TaxID=1827853 RepID=UPI0021CAA0D1
MAAPGQETSPANGQLSATLRRGDQGPEVSELQQRLHQLFLYNHRTDGVYSRQVEDAVRRYQWARATRTLPLLRGSAPGPSPGLGACVVRREGAGRCV